jgi:hypothetical protein
MTANNQFGNPLAEMFIGRDDRIGSTKSGVIAPSHIVATTHLVNHCVMTVESLHGAAATVNDRERKPAILAEHDELCPPLGQTIHCRVIPIEDGHHALVADYDMFPPPREIRLPWGERGCKQSSAKNRFPFTSAEFHHPENFSVSTDPTKSGGCATV